jgi:hypothetical protein
VCADVYGHKINGLTYAPGEDGPPPAYFRMSLVPTYAPPIRLGGGMSVFCGTSFFPTCL